MMQLHDQAYAIWSNWIMIASTEVDMLRGFLLTACRHISQSSSDQGFAELAIQYKLNHVHDLQRALLAKGAVAGRTAVTKALVLATDDVGFFKSFWG